jgi:hypothetical protein
LVSQLVQHWERLLAMMLACKMEVWLALLMVQRLENSMELSLEKRWAERLEKLMEPL